MSWFQIGGKFSPLVRMTKTPKQTQKYPCVSCKDLLEEGLIFGCFTWTEIDRQMDKLSEKHLPLAALLFCIRESLQNKSLEMCLDAGKPCAALPRWTSALLRQTVHHRDRGLCQTVSRLESDCTWFAYYIVQFWSFNLGLQSIRQWWCWNDCDACWGLAYQLRATVGRKQTI